MRPEVYEAFMKPEVYEACVIWPVTWSIWHVSFQHAISN